MGLDIGEKRIGVALSDATGTVATPLMVIPAVGARGDAKELVRLVEDYEVDRIVVGLPLSLDGTEGPQAARVRSVVGRLPELLGIPLDFFDERYSSAEAKRTLMLGGLSSRQQRGALDSVAAAVFLQSYLDSRRETGETIQSPAEVD
jgi:putative holliday junction resolvase